MLLSFRKRLPLRKRALFGKNTVSHVNAKIADIPPLSARYLFIFYYKHMNISIFVYRFSELLNALLHPLNISLRFAQLI